MKISNLIDQVLYEKKINDSIKLFYNIDIFIQESKPEIEETPVKTNNEVGQEPTPENAVAPQETPPEGKLENQSTIENNKVLMEEIYKNKISGKESIAKNKATNIQTIDDFLDLIHKIKNKEGKRLISNLVVQIILALANQTDVAGLITKKDRIIIDLDYGFSKENIVIFFHC